MPLIHRAPKQAPVETPQPEVYTEPTEQEMREHKRQLDKEETDAISTRNEVSAKLNRGINESFFKAELLREEQVKSNRPIVGPKLTNADAVAAAKAAYHYAPYDPTQDPTHPLYVVPNNPSRVLQTRPEQEEKPKYIPSAPLTEAEKIAAVERMTAYLATKYN